MEIKVLGGGCASCKKLLETVHEAVKELNADANILYITDMAEIMQRGIMSTPGLIINGKVKSMGRVPKLKEIKKMISDAIKKIRNRFNRSMNMKTLKIEWRHLDVQGETCDRCYDTGENLANEVKRLKRALGPQGIEIVLTETKLDDSHIPQSNTILFNDVPIEDILDISVSENFCESCTSLLGHKTYCRTVVFDGNEYEDIPAKAIRQAAYKTLGLDEKEQKNSESSNCGCQCSGKCC